MLVSELLTISSADVAVTSANVPDAGCCTTPAIGAEGDLVSCLVSRTDAILQAPHKILEL